LFNPNDNNQISVVGNGMFRLYKYFENNLKPSPVKLEHKNVLCHAWTADDRVICGTEEGRVYVFEATGELKFEFLHATLVPNPNGAAPIATPQAVYAISSFSKGVLVAGAGGLVNLYERGDELTAGKDVFHKTRDFILSKATPHTITKLSLAPSEEKFVCQNENNQLFTAFITSDAKLEQVILTVLGDSLHSSTITSLDTCIRKPLVVTCSTDNSIRIWNYIDDRSESTKLFSESILSVSFHPSGLYILVGFEDKLLLMNVLIDDLRIFKEFPVRHVKESKFSNGGQYFAAISTNLVYIYSTWRFELLGTLKGKFVV
jgi:cilia- and flagella-associated protein 57